MSDEGERICPLCAEEMDLTDQQLKPCMCGYEICVWCWHHIMEMAEKDDTEGRCPACRAPYNKEKIVGMAANCERLVAEMNMEKKFKTQKCKTRTSEGRKQLSSVRVIQRSLVYIVGLPLNLAEEDLLQRKEYFGQYGKVQKVSISRTAAGTIQQFANSTCSVYITYSKEEEAVRCIQAVHGFVLEGRPLRACFGTTKYCHAWLRNVPCSNPDCLYLHEIGSQEDSFSKDEIISAYTRIRVQQITSATNNLQRHAGSVLPPPGDDYLNNSSTSSGKPISKIITNNSSSCIKISPPNSSSGRSVTLPAGASWGTRNSNNQSTSASVPPSNGPQNQKMVACNGPVAFSAALASSNHVALLHGDMGRKLVPAEDPVKQNLGADSPSRLPDSSSSSAHPTPTTISCKLYCPPVSRDKDKHVILTSKITNSYDSTSESSSPSSVKDSKDIADETVNSVSSDMLSMSIDKHQGHGLEEGCLEQFRQTLTPQAMKSVGSNLENCVSRIKSESGRDSETPGVQIASHEEKDDLISFVNQRLKDPEVRSDGSYFPNISHVSYDHRGLSPLVNCPSEVHGDMQVVDNKVESVSQLTGTPFLFNGYPENQLNSVASLTNNVEQPCVSSNDMSSRHMERLHTELSIAGQSSAPDVGESSIISNILSLDLDTPDDSRTSPQNLAKFLGEADRHQASHRISSSWNVQQSNQSRFSFAREEEPISHGIVADSFLDFTDHAFKHQYFGHGLANKSSFHGDKFDTRNGFLARNTEEPDAYAGSHSLFSSSKLPVSRSQITAPPGFPTPSRAPPPPGFLSQERVDQTFNSFSEHHMHGTSLLRNQYHSAQAGNNFSNGDIEFMDPAILAVGKGRLPDGLSSSGLDMRSSFSPHLNNFENDARIQLLMQRSLSHQNQRFTDVGDAFSSPPVSLRNPSRVMDQSLASNMPPFPQSNLPQSRHPLVSNGHWDGWNEVRSGNNHGMTELLRPERFGFNKYYTGYEDSKLRMPGQGDMYNRTFGI